MLRKGIQGISFLFVVAALFFPCVSAAGQNETDLNGFRLLQFKDVVEKALGPSFKSLDQEDSVAEAHQIDQEAYMVFIFDKKKPNNISSIQITGKTRNMIPFKGLVLGDPIEKIDRVLGKPAATVKSDLPGITRLEYKKVNYNIEIDKNKQLYSILIMTPEEPKSPEIFKGSWPDFKSAILSKDFKRVAPMLRPDMEIYHNGKTLWIDKRFSEFAESPGKEWLETFFGEKGSVLQEVQKTEPESEFRLSSEVGGGEVLKFKNGKILNEISFFPFNGENMVYEITFRNK